MLGAWAEQNKVERRTVQWRYAILRMHEVVARAIPYLDEEDLEAALARFEELATPKPRLENATSRACDRDRQERTERCEKRESDRTVVTHGSLIYDAFR